MTRRRPLPAFLSLNTFLACAVVGFVLFMVINLAMDTVINVRAELAQQR